MRIVRNRRDGFFGQTGGFTFASSMLRGYHARSMPNCAVHGKGLQDQYTGEGPSCFQGLFGGNGQRYSGSSLP